ncbi:hypothetical protein O4J56_01395 [Nocardiopsis sp. RSe5-2]|uniref:DUF3558 domain-containing protein n=1 Tax=Nocardiopsis endophytica TaxID=3018445 RepID=A0ABT4TX54_9ACTN|nr:hypothetical protein [Nocardiopsis endophytica]MDA2809279.1 hypothetical protein [Nocardiopsis endophytica]
MTHPPPPPPYGPPGPPGPPAPPMPPPARTGVVVGITVAVTLVVAGSLTAAGVYAYDRLSTSGPRTAPGLPADPCGAIGEDVLRGLDAEPESQSTMRYETLCSWKAEVDGREADLTARWLVPYTESDSELTERYGDEEAPRDADAAYEQRIEQASEPDPYAPEEAEAETEERDLGLGEESVLILADIDDGFDYTDGSEQRATVIVRDGDVVGTLVLAFPDDAEPVDIDEAEDLLGDAAAAAFGG